MYFKIRKAHALVVLLASTTFSNAMAENTHDVVINSFGNKVVNSFGNCVRTRWDTGYDKCTVAMPAVSQPAPVSTQEIRRVPVENSRSYLVFFDWDKSNLTEDARDILNTVYADAEQKHATAYIITGHADRSGPDSYNLALSQRRADAVKRQLMAMGADEDIETAAKGESEPLVPTADGVREPQNRRVEVIFEYME